MPVLLVLVSEIQVQIEFSIYHLLSALCETQKIGVSKLRSTRNRGMFGLVPSQTAAVLQHSLKIYSTLALQYPSPPLTESREEVGPPQPRALPPIRQLLAAVVVPRGDAPEGKEQPYILSINCLLITDCNNFWHISYHYCIPKKKKNNTHDNIYYVVLVSTH